MPEEHRIWFVKKSSIYHQYIHTVIYLLNKYKTILAHIHEYHKLDFFAKEYDDQWYQMLYWDKKNANGILFNI